MGPLVAGPCTRAAPSIQAIAAASSPGSGGRAPVMGVAAHCHRALAGEEFGGPTNPLRCP